MTFLVRDYFLKQYYRPSTKPERYIPSHRCTIPAVVLLIEIQMAPSRTQDRPWVIIDSDEERLRLLEEAYSKDPGALTSEDLYELCDLKDPFWALLQPSDKIRKKKSSSSSEEGAESMPPNHAPNLPSTTCNPDDKEVHSQDVSELVMHSRLSKSNNAHGEIVQSVTEEQNLQVEGTVLETPRKGENRKRASTETSTDGQISPSEALVLETPRKENRQTQSSTKANTDVEIPQNKDLLEPPRKEDCQTQILPRPTSDTHIPRDGVVRSETSPKEEEQTEISTQLTADTHIPRDEDVGSATPPKEEQQTEISTRMTPDGQTMQAEVVMPRTPEKKRSGQSKVVILETALPPTPHDEPGMSRDGSASIRPPKTLKKRPYNTGEDSSDGTGEGPQLKIRRIESKIDTRPKSPLEASESIGGNNEAEVRPQLISAGKRLLSAGEARQSNVQTWLEASHEYIPVLLLSALILHVYTRNL